MKNNWTPSRREFMRAAAAVAAGALLPGRAALAQGAAARRPNIVYLLADDLGYADVGCFGQEKIRTPNIDRLAEEGLKLTDHYSAAPLCAPARCSLMTGKHMGHAAIRDNGRAALPADETTVAEVLKKTGYATAATGKWGLGENGSTGDPLKRGFDHFYGYLNQGRAHFYYPDYMDADGEREPLPANADGKRGSYSHDLITERALAFIRENRDNPFFLYVPWTIPHAEVLVPEDSMEEYAGKFPEKPFKGGHYAAQPTPNAARAGMITRMDRDVGRIVALLKELGLEKDTLVIFTSDNGPCPAGGQDYQFFNSTGPLSGAKRSLREGGIRVPFVAWWPGRIEPGTTSAQPSAFWDMMPTFAELAGAEVPDDIDGVSIVPTLLGRPKEQKPREYLYWEYQRSRAVRAGDWKLLKEKDGSLKLFNLADDIAENNDVSAGSPEIFERLKGFMEAAHTAPGK